MLPRTGTGSKKRSAHLVLALAIFLGLFTGVTSFGAPAERVLQRVRDLVRAQPASGRDVVVVIDDKSLKALGAWPWPRRVQARLMDRLRELGAARALLDFDYSWPTTRTDDAALGAAFKRWDGRATVATRFVLDPVSGARTDSVPMPLIRPWVRLANINIVYDYRGAIEELPYAVRSGGAVYPSLSAALARTSGPEDATYPIDFAIDAGSIPVVSAVDVIAGRTPRAAVAGKSVLLGTGSVRLGDLYLMPGRGIVPGVFFHALGAETLARGRPVDLGWFLPFVLALVLSLALVRTKGVSRPLLGLGGCALLLMLGALLLDQLMIFAEIVPSLVVVATYTGRVLVARYRETLRSRALTDPLSGLPNLNALRRQEGVEQCALVLARVVNYAEASATLPRDGERELVRRIAGKLDIGGTARQIYRGDEGLFAWFMPAADPDTLGAHLDALHAVFRAPVTAGGRSMDLVVAFGVDIDGGRPPSSRLGTALVAADEAVSAAERWRIYDPAQLEDAGWKLSLLSQLDAAIEGGDVWVAFQPKIDMLTRRIVGAEALVRWTHPDKGFISPEEFVRAAEQSNRIDKLTYHVMERAVEVAATINAQGQPFSIAVNMSASLIVDPAVPGRLAEIVARHGLPAEKLVLEITETAALSTSQESLQRMAELRAAGFKLSIDDYGTGMSTLDYLKRVPANEIKIDRSFIQSIGESQRDRVMVASTIQLAHSLGQTVVAEGVEEEATLEMLARMGCDTVQGYLLGRPMTFAALAERLALDVSRIAA